MLVALAIVGLVVLSTLVSVGVARHLDLRRAHAALQAELMSANARIAQLDDEVAGLMDVAEARIHVALWGMDDGKGG